MGSRHRSRFIFKGRFFVLNVFHKCCNETERFVSHETLADTFF
ncbi:hypothetical protein LTSEMIN_0690, partial [Salmonella enterica subsp. enterica serovar Minnesota str. A4-603]